MQVAADWHTKECYCSNQVSSKVINKGGTCNTKKNSIRVKCTYTKLIEAYRSGITSTRQHRYFREVNREEAGGKRALCIVNDVLQCFTVLS